jgi:hypothetical protein
LANFFHARAREAGLAPALFTLNNQVNTLVRIRRLTGPLAQNWVRFKAGSSGAKLLVELLRDFPHGEHDDGPDALEMALRLSAELVTVHTLGVSF